MRLRSMTAAALASLAAVSAVAVSASAWLVETLAAAPLQEALEPLPAEPPIGGPFWTVVVPALLLAGTTLATWLLYRRFSRED